MKKLFFTLCALCLCGTMWGQTQDQTTGLYYTLDESNNATIVAPTDGSVYTNANLVEVDDTTHTFPAQIDGYNLTRIGASAFANSEISGKLVIPNTILNLCGLAFNECTELTQVNIEYGENVLNDENTTAYESSFNGCDNVKIVVLERDVVAATSGAVSTFAYVNGIYTVYIGEKVTKIPDYMFRSNNSNRGGCHLKTVISDAAAPPEIGSATFANLATPCTFYTKADYLNDYKADGDWVTPFGKDYMHAYDGEDPDEPTDEYAFYYDGLWYDPIFDEDGEETGEAQIIASQDEVYSGTISIPEIVYNGEKSYTVTRIDEGAFEDSNISGHVIIPANILYMGKAAFMGCTEITEVTYEYGPTALTEENNSSGASGSFSGCTKVTTVNLYRDIVSPYTNNTCQQPGAFVGTTSVATINIGPRVTSILRYMFRNTTYAYNGGGPIKTINCYAVEPPTLEYSPFARIGENTLNVPQGTMDAYRSAANWSDQINGTSTGNDYGVCTFQEFSNAFAITTHENGEGTAYATFYNGASDVELFDGELTAYYAYALDDEGDAGLYIEIAEIGNSVPAATGVIVETEKAGTYLAIATGTSTTFSETNDLYGYDSAQTIDTPSVNDYYFYLLSSSGGNVGFYWGNSEGGAFQCQAHRAYLALLKDDVDNNPNQISIRKGSGEDTTGISSVESTTEGASVKGIYTIQGVRVSNMNQPGLYIVDGKKVLVK